jgi:acetoin utilization protein AcuB
MLASELIDVSIVPLRPGQTVGEALQAIHNQLTMQVVVMEGDSILGILSESVLLEVNEDVNLAKVLENLPPPLVLADNQSELEAIRVMAENKLEVLPLVNAERKCVGIISLRNAFYCMGRNFAPATPGGILVLLIHPQNFQLSQIAQIVEAGDAIINAMYMNTVEDGRGMLVTLFTNKEDLDGIVQTFRRYDYEVIGTFYRSLDETRLQERYRSLMRYLNT